VLDTARGGTVDRRDFLKAAAFTTAGAVVGPTLLERASSMIASPALAASRDALFGCSAQAYAGKSREQLITYLEGLAGAPFDTVQNRFGWTTSLVNTYSRWIVETGRTPILAWSTHGGGRDVPWAQIARGDHDARVRSEARKIASEGWEAYFVFHKEPEDEPKLGSAKDWRSAHDRVYEIFHEEGATNVTFVANLMASTYNGLNGGPSTWLPPRFDVVGTDGYNRNKRGDWRTFESIFEPSLHVARDVDKPLYVIESGCVEGGIGRKGDWFREVAATVASWPELIGVSYNHEAGNSNNDVGMNYRVDTSDLAMQGFRDMAQHPAFAGDGGGGADDGDGGDDGTDGTDGGGDCAALQQELAVRRERTRRSRAKLGRQRRKTRRLRARAGA
jgi:hypothetical protein